ncbi:MAG: acetyl-CoA carboxylase biotin carboxyl carrier protein [Candidatus Sumerlaeaceae bacterium]|nr:acetyl-CoA carboxylase biotin carboxyl carrier protein [Candidatus Sumerlaeaceae bacterium]
MAEKPEKKKSAATAASDDAPLSVSLGDIKSVFELMKANDIAELDIEQHGAKLRVVSIHAHSASAPQHYVTMAPHAAPVAAPAAAPAQPAASATGPAPVAEAPKATNIKTILSPMVGTFYRSPAPDADSFVKVGDHISEESVICIIEAMKLFNEIKAEMRGKIVRVHVENGVPVEYNQPLFDVEPD